MAHQPYLSSKFPYHRNVSSFLKHRIIITRPVLLFLCVSTLFLLVTIRLYYLPSTFTNTQRFNSVKNDETIAHLLEAPFFTILKQNKGVLFLLEPFLLTRLVAGSEEELEEFKWKFNLPQEFKWKRNSLTAGVFVEQLEEIQIINFSNFSRISGTESPLSSNSEGNSVIHHLFYQFEMSPNTQIRLLHIVVFHRGEHFFWIGSIPTEKLFSLTDDSHFGLEKSHNLHFGRTEQIFDLFNLTTFAITRPDDLAHFLGQLPTSRYLHCDRRKASWLQANNYTVNERNVKNSEEAIVNFKAFMRAQEMEFWMACGTLLGWYRQCSITPYTTDVDFASWSRYLKGRNVTLFWKEAASRHSLDLYLRFGEPTATQEFSFKSLPSEEKTDLFFVYPNGSHYLLPFHYTPKYTYSWYPAFELCSGELLGWKLLVPCDPEMVVRTEYGPDWEKPKAKYNYVTSPFNVLPLVPYTYNGSQSELL